MVCCGRRSVWYARLAMEHLIFDELEAAIDPNAARPFRMIEQRARRDYHQRFFWKPERLLRRRRTCWGLAGYALSLSAGRP